MDEDPEILAAIEASKQDYMDGEDLEDPLIKAALAESMKEVENNENNENSNDDKFNENVDKEVEADENVSTGGEAENGNEEEKSNDATSEDENSQEECDNKEDANVSGVNETPAGNPLSSEEGEEGKTNGHRVEVETGGETEESKNIDNENNDTETDSQGGGEITLEGVPEIQENPFTTEQTPANTSECDPLDDSGGGGGEGGEGGEGGGGGGDMDQMSELIDQVDPARSRHTSAGSSKSNLSGTKRKRSSSGSSGQSWESNKKKEPRLRAKEVLFNCPVCTFNSEVLGEMNIHKFRSHTGQQKPSYLDLAEHVIAQLDDKFGSKKEVILEVGVSLLSALCLHLLSRKCKRIILTFWRTRTLTSPPRY